MKSSLVRFRCSEEEAGQLDAICTKNGKTQSELIRTLITERYRKEFPAYATSAREKKAAAPAEPEVALTNEQLCEQAGGKVARVDGVEMCVFQLTSSMQRRVPLAKPELFKN